MKKSLLTFLFFVGVFFVVLTMAFTFSPQEAFAQEVNYGLIVDQGNVGIGTATPSAKLEISGGTTKTTGGLIIETRISDPGAPEDGRMWLRTDL